MDISRPSTADGDGSPSGNRLAAVATDDTRSGTSPGLDAPPLVGARATTAWQAEGKAMIAEFIGTFTLIFAGVGAIAVTAPLGAASLVPVALAHGLALVVMITATAAISGGHLNPAVTFGALLGGKIQLPQAIGHWVAQVLGGMAGALVIFAFLPAGMLAKAGYGVPAPGAGVGSVTAVFIELVLTFFLVFVVFGSAIDDRAPKVGGLFIGLTVAMDILVGGPLTGAAMNPARFLGPAIVYATDLQYTWIYLLGPLLGGGLAGLIWRFVFLNAPQKAAA